MAKENYRFIITWQQPNGTYVRSRQPMVLSSRKDDYIVMQYITDLDCSLLVEPGQEIIFHIIAFPTNIEWELFSMLENKEVTSPFICIHDIVYRVPPISLCGQRFTQYHDDLNIGFFIKELKNGYMLIDTPIIIYKIESLNQKLSAIDI